MPSYLSLISFTEQGIRAIKESPQRLDAAKQQIEASGGRLIFYYMLLGQYDLAALTEFPDDESAARFALALGAQGNVRTQTLKAFTEDEMRAVIGGLP